MKDTGSKQHDIKESNQKSIIKSLIQMGPTSRADLAKHLGLSAPSISKNIVQLLEAGILSEIGEGESLGGRKPIMLDIDYRIAITGAVDLSGSAIRVAISGLDRQLIDRRNIPFPEDTEGKLTAEAVSEAMKELLQTHGIEKSLLKVLVVGMPAVVNEDNGMIKVPGPWLCLNDVMLFKETLQALWGVKVLIKNDINLAALGESASGEIQNPEHLLYINIDMGVGAGLILDRRIFEGARCAAGEVGYYSFNKRKPGSMDRVYGPLESRISIPAIAKRAALDLEAVAASMSNAADPEELLKAAVLQNNPGVLAVLEDVYEDLSLVLCNMMYMLDLEWVVLGGRISEIDPACSEKVSRRINEFLPFRTEVIKGRLGSRAVLYGAFELGAQDILERILFL